MSLKILPLLRLTMGLGCWPLVHAQTVTPTTPITPTPTTGPVQTSRFVDLNAAGPAVAVPAKTVTGTADAVRQSLVNPAATSAVLTGAVTQAVTQANTAIVREGQVARAEVLSNRQSSVTQLRLAQTEAERQRRIVELREQFGARLDEQREVARLVRDRLRQVRDNATLTRPPGP